MSQTINKTITKTAKRTVDEIIWDTNLTTTEKQCQLKAHYDNRIRKMEKEWDYGMKKYKGTKAERRNKHYPQIDTNSEKYAPYKIPDYNRYDAGIAKWDEGEYRYKKHITDQLERVIKIDLVNNKLPTQTLSDYDTISMEIKREIREYQDVENKCKAVIDEYKNQYLNTFSDMSLDEIVYEETSWVMSEGEGEDMTSLLRLMDHWQVRS